MIDCLSISKGIARSVDDLLTTRQLQDLLQVDRITIYRMLRDGRLRGFKVGGQWRFLRQEIETWLQGQRADLELAEGLPVAGSEPLSPSKVLPLSCVEAIQGVCSEALDVAAITIDLNGTPLTDISNSCDFCNLILSTDEGRRRCMDAWQFLGHGQIHPCHAGLLRVSAPIEVGGRQVAVTAGCQFGTRLQDDGVQTWVVNLDTLAADLGLREDELRAAADSVRLVPENYLPRVARLLRRVA